MRDNKISVVVASTKLAAIEEEENEVDRELINNSSSPDPSSAAKIGAHSSCFSTLGDSPIVRLFKAASAVVSNPGCPNPTPFYTMSKRAEAAGDYYFYLSLLH